ncbi:hypothetical protein HOE52_02090, partial [Candidatus Woesearchaeota archaeon]|nr:hypothetical protein [Candidatus Woesearchaeota archaeon]
TTSADDFKECITEAKKRLDCLVGIGGDGIMSDIINAGPNDNCILGYLAYFGSGRALGWGLGYNMQNTPPTAEKLTKAALRILHGKNHSIDAILCETPSNSSKALIAGVGIEADVINRSEGLRKAGMGSLNAYVFGSLVSVFGGYQRATISIEADEQHDVLNDMVTFLVMKHPYFGYGLRANPHAVLDSGKLHGLALSGGIPMIAKALATSVMNGNIFGGNTQGRPYTADRIKLTSTNPLPLHVDGNSLDVSTEFEFTILPKELTFRY